MTRYPGRSSADASSQARNPVSGVSPSLYGNAAVLITIWSSWTEASWRGQVPSAPRGGLTPPGSFAAVRAAAAGATAMAPSSHAPLRTVLLPRGHCGRGLLDESGHRGRVRDVDGVATGNLDHGGTGPLGHSALRRRGDHPIFGGHQVPARLVPPGGVH